MSDVTNANPIPDNQGYTRYVMNVIIEAKPAAYEEGMMTVTNIKPSVGDPGYLVAGLSNVPEFNERVFGWLPKDIFEGGLDTGVYFKPEGMSFGQALLWCKMGLSIWREGWDEKGLKVVYQKGYPDGIPYNVQTAAAWGMKEGDIFKLEPYLQISTADGSHEMWVPSIRDCLANDWHVDCN